MSTTRTYTEQPSNPPHLAVEKILKMGAASVRELILHQSNYADVEMS